MSKLRFSDGVEIDTSGQLRILKLHDGLYVTGEGFLVPVKDEPEATATIQRLTKELPLERLINITNELNSVAGLDPQLKTDVSRSTLLYWIEQGCKLLYIEDKPMFSEQVFNDICNLGWWTSTELGSPDDSSPCSTDDQSNSSINHPLRRKNV